MQESKVNHTEPTEHEKERKMCNNQEQNTETKRAHQQYAKYKNQSVESPHMFSTSTVPAIQSQPVQWERGLCSHRSLWFEKLVGNVSKYVSQTQKISDFH